MTSIKNLLRWGQSSLSTINDSVSIDAEMLLCHTLDCSRAYLYSHSEEEIDDATTQAYKQLIKSRMTGYPVAYLTGKQGFWTLELEVNEHTLIPRPETELLVHLGLEKIKLIERPMIIDLGTGSGAVALAMARERPDAHILAVDLSFLALRVAQKNQRRYHYDHINFVCADWLKSINPDPIYELIITNPPYVAETDPHLLSDIRFEPKQALTSGLDGLNAVTEIIATAKQFLKDDGWLFIEHGYNQKGLIKQKFKDNSYTNIQCWQDHSGLDRVSAGQK